MNFDRGTNINLIARRTARREIDRALLSAVDALNDGFAIYDASDRLILCNSKYIPVCFLGGEAACHGLTFEAIMHRYAASDAAPSVVKSGPEKWIADRLQEHRAATGLPFEQQLNNRWLRITENRTPDNGRSVVISDITEIKRGESILRDAIDVMEDGFGVFDPEDRIILHNRAFIDEGSRALLGENLVGRKFEEIVRAFAYHDMPVTVADFDRESWIAQRMERHRNPPPYPIEVQWSNNRWMRISERRTFDGGYVGIWSDISGLKLAERRLQDAIDNINEGFALIDADDRFVVVNQHYVDMYPKSGPLAQAGQKFADVLRQAAEHGEYPGIETPDEIEAHIAHWLAIYAKRQPYVGERQLADGRWILVSHRPTMSGGYVSILTGITQLKQRQDELRSARDDLEIRSAELVALAEELEVARNFATEANRSKSLFLANMSHELRTPLNSINGFSEMIANEALGPIQPAKYREYADFIHRSGLHLLSLINDILDLSKIEAGKMELQVEAVPTEQVAYASLAEIRTLAAEHNIALTTELDPKCPIIHADQRAIRQILLNLLSNAVKFTPRDGTVTLTANCTEGGVELTVIDTGIGMTAEEARKALELYGQVQSDLSRKRTGTGLGLPLVKSLVELHGGKLRLQSEKDRGTTASVILPWKKGLPTQLN